MPALDPGRVGFSFHTLINCLMVTKGTVELLLWSLDGHPDPQVQFWLQGLGHLTEMMHHTVSQLDASSSLEDAQLQFLKLDLAVLV